MEVTHTQEGAFLTVSDAARILGLSADTIRRHADSGVLPTYRTPGNQRRFRESDVRALVRKESAA